MTTPRERESVRELIEYRCQRERTELAAMYRRAAEIIRTNGWAQGYELTTGARATDGSAVDVVGALRVAITGTTWSDDAPYSTGAVLVAERRLAEQLGLLRDPREHPTDALTDWNDDLLDRTVDEVLDALERAAVAAESGGAA
jgi:hypothetical protein